MREFRGMNKTGEAPSFTVNACRGILLEDMLHTWRSEEGHKPNELLKTAISPNCIMTHIPP
jgi:hypothetical protein